MTKSLIAAIFLSYAPIQDVRVFHEQATIVEYMNAELDLYTRRVHTIHIHMSSDRTVVVEDGWYSQKEPVPYYQFWDCPWQQTAQQCVAIESLLEQALTK